jgi:hypothetical protein
MILDEHIRAQLVGQISDLLQVAASVKRAESEGEHFEVKMYLMGGTLKIEVRELRSRQPVSTSSE